MSENPKTVATQVPADSAPSAAPARIARDLFDSAECGLPHSVGAHSAPRVRSRRAAGVALLEHVSRAFQRAGFADPGFLLHWPEIAGAHIARVAQPVRWQESPGGAVVTLCCEPGAAVLLQHETRRLVEKCNSYLGHGRIARFKFVNGTVSAEAAIPPHPGPHSQPGSDKTSLNDALENLRLARAQLGRRH